MLQLLSLLLLVSLSPIWPMGDNPRVGDPYIIVNKQNNKLAFIDDGMIQKVYPVATGKTNDLTPEGEFDVVMKVKNPYYIKGNIPGGSPKNPLGSRWIGFNAKGTEGNKYGIHGTNQPSSIGKYISQGCIRMYPKDVETLYEKVPVGTKVLIVRTKKSFEQLAKEKGAMSRWE
ncbi:L,D-transpeptidase [Ectobacillus antri]|jgi:lipoprotein-anchoring transpeptidase ErfK/SrfK|uniref:L,D-transpeptidase n=1 Tax=Ectobacillus antri TaxID=2486280 RepID=A0ABT6H345_9BACI|nr:L,D-transpeptidase [Ectobacillus antri]MDG4655639.1 L,D-transpeptidase [Ectobacillus antri]MDG5753397.1 L,D-transpeptidase [Ectobacillus antri]